MYRVIKRTICLLFCIIFSFALFACNDDFEGYFVDVNHIINPVTGMPYSIIYNKSTKRYENTTDHIISTTVIGPSAMENDCYSTSICVMGVNKSRKFIEGLIDDGKIDAAILFTEDKKMLVYGEVAGYNVNNNYSGYKEYEAIHGDLNGKISIEEYTIPDGTYSRYNEFAFTGDFEFTITLFGNDDNLKKAIKEELIAKVEELDSQVNPTLENSDLSRINKSAKGERVEIGKYCYYLLSESIRINKATDGAFNIAVAPLSRLWNVDIDGITNYKSIGKEKYWTSPESLPNIKEVEELKKKVDLNGLEVFSEEGKLYAVRTNTDLELDLGGIAKGYALDLCKDILRYYEVQSAQLIISGHIYEIGNNFNKDTRKNSTWKIGITHPALKHDIFKENSICAIEILGNTSITTSGDYERFYSFKYEMEKKISENNETQSPDV